MSTPPVLTQSLGLMALRNYCQAYGIFISGAMDTQRPATDWLQDLCDIANAAPIWTGAKLNFIPRCEVSTVGNGAIYIAPTSSGPVIDLDDSVFISKNQPPVTIKRTRPADAYNILPIEHINRANQYSHEVTTVRDQGNIFKRGQIKATVKQLLFIHDQQTAVMVGWPLLRRQTLVERLEFKFILPKSLSWLDPYDLVTITDAFIGITKFPVRLTSLKETSNFELECTAEPYYYGAHAPTAQIPTSVPVNSSFNQSADPGSVNPPLIFEAVARLNQFQNQGAIWLTTSGSNPNYGGCAVFISTDGGATYPTQIGAINGNPIMGALTADFPATTNDPDNADTLSVDLTQSAGALVNFTLAQMNAFVSLCWIENGGVVTAPDGVTQLTIPYELIAYETANLVIGNQYNIVPPTRRGVYNTPMADHPAGSRFFFIDTGELIQYQLDPALIGKTLFFKFAAFNIFGQQEQTLDLCTPYAFTPTGQVGGSQVLSASSYSTSPASLVFQGKSGGWPGYPSFTDPTKIYIVAPFTANFASGAVQYASPGGPVVIPTPVPTTLWVTIFDPGRTGSGTLFVDTDNHRWNTPGYTRVGTIFIVNISTGGGVAPPVGPTPRNIYQVTPAADSTTTLFTIVGPVPALIPYVDVYINGILQPTPSAYTLIGNQITFTSAPKGATTNVPADVIEVVF